MLLIKMKRREGVDERAEFEWHTGKARPGGLNLDRVEEIQADGDELKYIRHNFDNLPMANHVHVVRWRGDLARFILSNI